jgi:AcrR family transcriptional regulator
VKNDRPTSRKPRRGRPTRHESELLDAACAAFARHGLAGAAMDQIAAAGGVSKPSLYARFGSKERLYERVLLREADAFIARLFESYDAAHGMPVAQGLHHSMVAFFDHLTRRPQTLPLLFAPDRSGAAQRVASDVEERVVGRIAQIVERKLADDGRHAPAKARFLASMVFGAAISAARHAQSRGLDADRSAALAASFLYAGYRDLDVGLFN